ncbi:MAG: transglutaminaseTgpA domain-containing protein [Synechococcus sp.]
MRGERRSSSLAWWALLPLLLQSIALNWSSPITWPTWGLVLCCLLKLRECRKPFDRRLVALLQLVTIGLLAAQLQNLLASGLQLLAMVLALAGLLGQELAGALTFRGFLRRSLQLLAAALPLALVLFLFVPRIPPLWSVQLGPTRGAVSGLSPQLDPLGIAELALRDGSAARLSVPQGERLPTDRYWRVLVHEQFDGRRWRHRDPSSPRLATVRSPDATGSSQWWVVEPSFTKAVPWDGSAWPTAQGSWITPEGELLVDSASRQRRSFRLQSSDRVGEWQRRLQLRSELQLPPTSLPRLQTLARQWRQQPRYRDRLQAAEAWFRSQPFRYSLQPGAAEDLDAFLFDQQVGFCGHYASALAALMRAAGVPARVVSGYQGGHLVQPLGGSPYLELRQSDAHAWVEVWLEGTGWSPVDPTLWASESDPAIAVAAEGGQRPEVNAPWWRWFQRQWWGLDFAWTRWLLSFDQASQQTWLEGLFGGEMRWLGVVIVVSASVAALGGWLLMRAGGVFRPMSPLTLSLRLLARLDVEPRQGESFSQLCQRAAKKHPDQATLLEAMAQQQQLIAHAPLTASQRRHRLSRWRHLRASLFHRLR